MYDVRKALNRFKPLIRWTAYRFSMRSNSSLTTYEDVEAEGFLTLVKCCREFPEGEKRFGRYFKRAWYNRLKDMNRHRLYLKRVGIEVDLDCAEDVPAVSERAEFLGRMRDQYDEICPLLSDDAKKLLLMLLDPTPAVGVAYDDFIEAQRQHRRGKSVVGYKKFRIRLCHIREVLGMSKGQMWNTVREVKSIMRGK